MRVQNISASIKDLPVPDKKSVFISEILGAALIINEEIANNREKLVAILKKDTSSYTAYDKELLKHVMEEVRLKQGQESEILLRYDVLPIRPPALWNYLSLTFAMPIRSYIYGGWSE